MAATPSTVFEDVEDQYDFSGGENSVADKLFVRKNQVAASQNMYPRRGGGLTQRGGYKKVNSIGTNGRMLLEMEQTVGTVLTFEAAGVNYYDESMQPAWRGFETNPVAGSFMAFGSREKFNQLILN